MADSVGYYDWEIKFNDEFPKTQDKPEGFITIPTELVPARHIDAPYGKIYYCSLTPYWTIENGLISEF